jgi:hypothetical protein
MRSAEDRCHTGRPFCAPQAAATTWYVSPAGLIPTRGLWGSIPLGLATMCLGLATIFPERPVYEWLMALGSLLVLLAIVAPALGPRLDPAEVGPPRPPCLS